MAKIFTVPFALTGDKSVIPDALQPDGSVSFTQGFGFDYERPTTDPLYKPFPRDPYNWLMGAITEALGQIQLQGYPSWGVDGAPYPVNAQVRHNGINWRSNIAANSTEPGTAPLTDWTNLTALAEYTAGGLVPAGIVAPFAGPVANIPQGWLLCDFSTLNRVTYAKLFAAVGTAYGAGDGTTTFNVPELRGEIVRGLDNGRGVDPGRTLASLQAGQNESHSHTGGTTTNGNHSHVANTSYSGTHTHPTTIVQGSATWLVGGGGTAIGNVNTTTGSDGNHYHTVSVNTAGDHSHSFTTAAQGGNEARMRNVAMNFIIKY